MQNVIHKIYTLLIIIVQTIVFIIKIDLGKGNHNPSVGGSNPSYATTIINNAYVSSTFDY